MDSSVEVLLTALRKMESRIGKVIDDRGNGPERRVLMSVQHAMVSVFDEEYAGDEGHIFDREPFDDDSDDGPIFDKETLFDSEPVFDRVATFEFVDKQHAVMYADDAVVHAVDPELCYDCLDGGPIFDEERFVASEFYSDPVTIAAFDYESCDLSRAGADFDDLPLFDEAPEDLTSVKQFVLDSNSTAAATITDASCTCSTKCLSNGASTS
jgi:hypothetical protein